MAANIFLLLYLGIGMIVFMSKKWFLFSVENNRIKISSKYCHFFLFLSPTKSLNRIHLNRRETNWPNRTEEEEYIFCSKKTYTCLSQQFVPLNSSIFMQKKLLPDKFFILRFEAWQKVSCNKNSVKHCQFLKHEHTLGIFFINVCTILITL